MDISLDEVVQAVNALNRHKAAGADRLNNDFSSTPRQSWSLLFIHGSQILKTVMMMMAVLDTARHEPSVDMMQSKAIILLDLRKAYDTVARDFLFVALHKFGFSPAFVTMIQNIHAGTTAQFVVNGEISEPQEEI